MIDQGVRRIVLDLFQLGAIKFGHFRLKLHETSPNAPLSPIYLDLRMIRSSPPVLRDVAGILGRTAVSFDPDFVADVPTAATPIVGVISAFFDIPMLSPKLIKKTHGIQAQLEGIPRPGARVVVIDDLITTAESKVEAVEILRSQNLIVEHVVVLVDREQDGSAQLKSHGCDLHAIMTLRAMLEVLASQGCISAIQQREVLEYINGNT